MPTVMPVGLVPRRHTTQSIPGPDRDHHHDDPIEPAPGQVGPRYTLSYSVGDCEAAVPEVRSESVARARAYHHPADLEGPSERHWLLGTLAAIMARVIDPTPRLRPCRRCRENFDGAEQIIAALHCTSPDRAIEFAAASGRSNRAASAAELTPHLGRDPSREGRRGSRCRLQARELHVATPSQAAECATGSVGMLHKRSGGRSAQCHGLPTPAGGRMHRLLASSHTQYEDARVRIMEGHLRSVRLPSLAARAAAREASVGHWR